jgi:hypothetical protein
MMQTVETRQCVRSREVQLEYEDIKPIVLQLTARFCEKAKDGKAAWHVKIEPTSKECPALSQLRKKAGCRCTLVFTYRESKKKRGQDDTENRTSKRDTPPSFFIHCHFPARICCRLAIRGRELAGYLQEPDDHDMSFIMLHTQANQRSHLTGGGTPRQKPRERHSGGIVNTVPASGCQPATSTRAPAVTSACSHWSRSKQSRSTTTIPSSPASLSP